MTNASYKEQPDSPHNNEVRKIQLRMAECHSKSTGLEKKSYATISESKRYYIKQFNYTSES